MPNVSKLSPATEAREGNAGDHWSRPDFLVADLSSVAARFAPEGDAPRKAQLPAGAPISQPLLVGALLLFDLANLVTTGFLAYRSVVGPLAMDAPYFLYGLLAVAVVALFVLHGRWTYTIRAMGDFWRQCFSLGLALLAALAVWNAASVLTGAGEPYILRYWTLRWLAWSFAIGVAGRALCAYAVGRWTRQRRLARRTVIVGGGEQALETIGQLDKSGKGALQILGIFDDRSRSRLPVDLGGYRLLGSFDDLEAFCRENRVDLLIVAFPLSAEDRILHVLSKLWVLPVDVRISALGGKLTLRSRAYNYIGDVPFLPVFDKPMSDWQIAAKAIFDRSVAAMLIVLASPLLLALALGVKLSSPGPTLFVQTRFGFNNEKIGVFKFRSMFADRCDALASKLVTRGDPRVTKFGAFIRRTSLDELPQLFNVLRGELSLVGPRPHAIVGRAAGQIYEQVVEGYFARHRVKPGMTGWAQINGWRGETDTVEKIEQRVAHDLYYIENWSLWLDMKILVRTPVAVIMGKNAF
jgi:Undecaprenyl-phosphate glucose phosphotransferase